MALSVLNISRIETSAGASVSGAIANPSAKSLMVCAMSDFGGALANMQVSDSVQASSAYSSIVERGTVGVDEVALLYHQASAAGANSSGNCSGGAGTAGVVGVFYEIGGASTTAAFVGGEAGGATANSSIPATPAINTSVAASILIGAMTSDNDGNPIGGYTINAAGTVGTYSQNTSSGRELNGTTFPSVGSVYQIVASSGSQRHEWLMSTGNQWAAIIAGFGQNSGGGAAAAPIRLRGLMGVGY